MNERRFEPESIHSVLLSRRLGLECWRITVTSGVRRRRRGIISQELFHKGISWLEA